LQYYVFFFGDSSEMAIFLAQKRGRRREEECQKKSLLADTTRTPLRYATSYLRLPSPSLCIIVTNVLFIIGVKGRD
jgi:hypothetical protein